MKTHFGSPCIHCGLKMEDVKVVPCLGTGAAVPIAYAVIERRWDGTVGYRVRFSDGRIEDLWSHASMSAPYYHFGRSDDLTQPPRYDKRLCSPAVAE
jgi:hypothetical protein